jgi:AAA+ ATPase superfamily predicted ATPase
MKNQAAKIIGRIHEQTILKRILKSKKAEFLVLHGRRRVGKTFLIRNFFNQSPCIFFHTTGIQKGKLKEQLKQFGKQIGLTFYNGINIAASKNWFDAFENLLKAMQQVSSSNNIILFFDEFPWMSTRRSRLLQALEYYWNRYWNHDPRIKLIICGSSASWIIDKVINNKGGLYNRATQIMRLDPFTLYESKNFLVSQGIRLKHQQVLDLYMVLGGIPHYLALISPGLSAHQCINELCFQKNGSLTNEFHRLFASLFEESEAYIELVRAIAHSHYGIGLAQLARKVGKSKGGRIAKKLKQLEEAGFVLSFLPHGHQDKGIYYKIIDEYTLFYLHWIEIYLKSTRKQDRSTGYWTAKIQSPAWKSWSGLAFEAICHKHLAQIRKALTIDPGAEVGSWRYVPRSKKEENGAQIDLLFDRPDGVITICEIKHSEKPFMIDKDDAKNLMRKVEVYQEQTRTRKQIFLAMITSNGLKPSKYSKEIIQQEADLEDLFKF